MPYYSIDTGLYLRFQCFAKCPNVLLNVGDVWRSCCASHLTKYFCTRTTFGHEISMSVQKWMLKALEGNGCLDN